MGKSKEQNAGDGEPLKSDAARKIVKTGYKGIPLPPQLMSDAPTAPITADAAARTAAAARVRAHSEGFIPSVQQLMAALTAAFGAVALAVVIASFKPRDGGGGYTFETPSTAGWGVIVALAVFLIAWLLLMLSDKGSVKLIEYASLWERYAADHPEPTVPPPDTGGPLPSTSAKNGGDPTPRDNSVGTTTAIAAAALVGVAAGIIAFQIGTRRGQ